MGWLDAMNIETNDNKYKIKALEGDLRDLERELDYTERQLETERHAKYGSVDFYENVICRIQTKIREIESEIRNLER